MSDRPTPETDEKWETFCDESYYHLWRVRRKTERGFNDGFHIQHGEEAKALVELLNRLELERNEWAERWADLSRASLRDICAMERERDEAREKLDEEMKWHHRTHIELVQTQCKILDMQMGRDEIQEKYDTLAVENMLEVNKLCEERDELLNEIKRLRLDAQREAEYHDRMVKELESLYDKLKS